MSSSSAGEPAQDPRDGSLGWMILVSAGLHAAAVVIGVALPYTLRDTSPKLVSYTVDLVAPDRLGGTNIPGARPKRPPPPKPQAASPPPPVAAVEQPKPPEAPKPEPLKEKAKPPEPEPVAKPKEEPKPKAEPKVEPKVEKKPETKAAPVKVAAKKEPAAKPEVKPEPKRGAARPAEEKAAAAKPEAPPAKKEEAKPELSPQDAREAIAARLREERIAAAVKRAQDRVQESAAVGTGVGDASSPASIGPGEGSGGVLKGLEWLMYKNNVETTIRENWVWTGPDHSLETTIRFGITETGEVVEVRIEKSSGDPSYDASVERAVRMVNPLPPPPEAYRDDFRQYELTFNAEFLQM